MSLLITVTPVAMFSASVTVAAFWSRTRSLVMTETDCGTSRALSGSLPPTVVLLM